MSLLNVQKAQEFSKFPPVCTFTDKPIVIIEKGIQYCSPQVLAATSVSDQGVIFNIIPSNYNALLSRKWLLKMKFRCVIVSPDYGQAVYNSFVNDNLAAPRSYPINHVVSNATLSVNNISSFQNQNSSLIEAAQHINSFQEDLFAEQSTTPCQLDSCYDYNEVYPSSINPLNNYANSSFHDLGRGAFKPTYVSSTSSHTNLTLDYVFSEYLMLPFLVNSGPESSGLTKATSMQLQLQLSSLNNILSYNASHLGAWTSLTTSVVSAELLYNQYTMDMFTEVPKVLNYPFKVPSMVFTTNIGTTAANTTFAVQSQNVQLMNLPKALYCWVSRSTASKSYIHADAFAEITSISIQFGGKTGLLSSASQQTLYQISRKNGVNMSFPQWKDYIGSILCFDFVEDIPSGESDLAPNTSNFAGNFSVQVNGRNIDLANSWDLQLNMVFVSDQVLQVSDAKSNVAEALFTRQDVLRAKEYPVIPNTSDRNMIGYGIFGNINSFLKDSKLLSKGLKAVSGIASVIPHPVGQAVSGATGIGSTVAEKLGYGMLGGKKMKASDFRKKY